MENKLVVGILNIVEDKLREFGVMLPDYDREDSKDPIVGYQYAELHDRIQEYLVDAGVLKEDRGFGGAVKDNRLDVWRGMVRQEIALNGVSCYGMTEEEALAMQQDDDSIDLLAEYMDRTMYRVDWNEYRALELVFEESFCDVLDDFREARIKKAVEGLGLFCDAKVNGEILFVDCWNGESVEIFLADDGGLMCLLPGEDEAWALRGRVEDVEAGDAVLVGDHGEILTASTKACQHSNAWDTLRYFRANDNEFYFEDEIGSALSLKIKELLEKIPRQGKVLASVGKVLSEATVRSGEAVQRTDVDKIFE